MGFGAERGFSIVVRGSPDHKTKIQLQLHFAPEIPTVFGQLLKWELSFGQNDHLCVNFGQFWLPMLSKLVTEFCAKLLPVLCSFL